MYRKYRRGKAEEQANDIVGKQRDGLKEKLSAKAIHYLSQGNDIKKGGLLL
jgi:hypothetical protein